MPTSVRHAPRAAFTNGCRVLVVDDDDDNLQLLTALLRKEGYTVSEVHNGATALELLGEGLDPDLILTDLMMPVMSGWDFCESLKRSPTYRSIPIVVTCGMAIEPRGKLQVEAAFEKPIDTKALLKKLQELCGL